MGKAVFKMWTDFKKNDSREFLNIANAFNCAQQAGCVEEKPKYFEGGKKIKLEQI